MNNAKKTLTSLLVQHEVVSLNLKTINVKKLKKLLTSIKEKNTDITYTI